MIVKPLVLPTTPVMNCTSQTRSIGPCLSIPLPKINRPQMKDSLPGWQRMPPSHGWMHFAHLAQLLIVWAEGHIRAEGLWFFLLGLSLDPATVRVNALASEVLSLCGLARVDLSL
jgi:hypothetical protein